ncbi:alpha/beta hydrolase family protein [Sinorhizobium medicae]|uniref:AB hydrolase-1 domain-containing protein n=1 Tax=Sinorhizobium medicae TaxID=110321 RepID=A0A508WYQ5_9HYPH|nr:alpha/beta hydrolase family protein [Sinorhizobium medicae]VTZ62316.1 hypothetical protein EMEDMD4_370180 [Sinorhizobium medicae]
MSFAEFGLHNLRHHTSGTCVVFVHGILSDGHTAWGEPSWPEILRAEPSLEHIGIFIFTYRTSLNSRTYGIADVADALREHFGIDELWSVPNIVFVCHSMGGIVVRRFLVANQARLSDLRPTIGLFLVASPSLGSRDANMLSILSYVLRHTQAATLRFSQANTSLDELHRDFKTLLNGGKLTIVGRELLEDRPIKVKRWLGLWRQVVEPFAASAYFHQQNCEPLRIPGSDHSTIVKPLQSTALQHVALKRFLNQLPELARSAHGQSDSKSARIDSAAPQIPSVEAKTGVARSDGHASKKPPPRRPAALDKVTRSAILPERLRSFDMPGNAAEPGLVYDVAIKLRYGRMLERMLASAIVKRSQDPFSVFMSALDKSATFNDFELIAPWLRFTSTREKIEPVAEHLTKSFKLTEVDSKRLKVQLMGWAGCTFLPPLDWGDSRNSEKFSYYYTKSNLHAAWHDQGESNLRYLVRASIDANNSHRNYYNRHVSIFDFISAVKGMPASNTKIVLNEGIKGGAPSEMISALLHRLCITPTADATPDIMKLVQNSDLGLANAAKSALAFIPGRSEAISGLKRRSLSGNSAPFAAAVGTDLIIDAVDDLGAMLRSGNSSEASFNAAWALSRMSGLSSAAREQIKHGAIEHPDKLTRCICLIGLAIEAPQEAEPYIADEYKSARDMEKFCLSIAISYISDASQMLSLLANTGEDRLYVPFMFPCFQLLFHDAMKHAAGNSPILGEILSLTDDTF